jgi:hypothetical protein
MVLDNSAVAEFLVSVGLAMLVLAGVGVAGYFILRRLFERASARMADHIGLMLAQIVERAVVTPTGQRTSAAMRAATGRFTNLGAYAAAHGMSEEEARRQFSLSIERTARIMDSAVTLPIIGPVGLDAVLGLFPVAGDATAAGVAIMLIAKSLKYGVPREIITRMLTNVLIDLLLGAVPGVGDVADMWFRANARNVALLREFLGDEARNTIDVTRVS